MPHILLLKGSSIQDWSSDPANSPAYDGFTNWLQPSQDSAHGVRWKDGFLTCGGVEDDLTEEFSRSCQFIKVGETEAIDYPMITYPAARAATTLVNGKLWVTGGLRNAEGKCHDNQTL